MRLGLDRACSMLGDELKGLRVGLITNSSAVNNEAVIGAFILKRCLDVAEIYAPEHGFWASLPAGSPVPSMWDEVLGLRVTSLYGGKDPEDAWSSVDALIYDLQDVGVRTYTYLHILYRAVKYSASTGTPLYVLDRPNPLGRRVEGPVARHGFSAVAAPWIPLRYGLTPGELALFYASRIGGRVRVVPMEGWRGTMMFEDTGLPWAPPSPAIPSPITALVYAGTVLFEATNLSEGRGTYSPFLQIGAPWLNNVRLVEELSNSMDGVKLRPVEFRPAFSKHASRRCRGIYIHVHDKSAFKPVEAAIRILAAIIRKHREFKWIRRENGEYIIDTLLPGADLRSRIMGDVNELLASWREEAEGFLRDTEDMLLY